MRQIQTKGSPNVHTRDAKILFNSQDPYLAGRQARDVCSKIINNRMPYGKTFPKNSLRRFFILSGISNACPAARGRTDC